MKLWSRKYYFVNELKCLKHWYHISKIYCTSMYWSSSTNMNCVSNLNQRYRNINFISMCYNSSTSTVLKVRYTIEKPVPCNEHISTIIEKLRMRNEGYSKNAEVGEEPFSQTTQIHVRAWILYDFISKTLAYKYNALTRTVQKLESVVAAIF